MAATEPIRDKNQLKALGEYFLKRGQIRNYVLIVLGAHTVLRISDLLRLRWTDVYDKERGNFRTHVTISERKTGKTKTIALNKKVIYALRLYFPYRRGEFIFSSNRKSGNAISRVQAWRIIHAAVLAVGITGKVACHSLRKTWGYHACRSGAVPPAVIMRIYNHSSFVVTLRYLCISRTIWIKRIWQWNYFDTCAALLNFIRCVKSHASTDVVIVYCVLTVQIWQTM